MARVPVPRDDDFDTAATRANDPVNIARVVSWCLYIASVSDGTYQHQLEYWNSRFPVLLQDGD